MTKKVLKNAPFDSPNTIQIVEGEPGWEQAYALWIANKNPTDSPEWKKGVYLGIIEVEIPDYCY